MPAGRRRAPSGPQAGVITRLAVNSTRPDRTILYVDGRRAGDMATEVVQAAGLQVGGFLSEDDLAGLHKQDEPHRARASALRLLTFRDRSTSEVESRLRQSGFAGGTVTATVVWLKGLGYLDDARFSERYVAEKSRTGWGARRIRTELLRKGVARQTVDDALVSLAADRESESVPSDSLMVLVHRRFGSQWQADRGVAERRLTGFLLRRGYDWDTVARTVRRLDAELTSAPIDGEG